MGSACTKEQSEVVNVDVKVTPQIIEDVVDNNPDFDAKVDLKPKGPDCESIKSGSSGASRPPTPFSRPVTAAVIVRPKTTTISERAELKMEEVGEDGNDVLDEVYEEAEENIPELELPHPPKLRRTGSRTGNGTEHVTALRQVSRNIAEDDTDIIKMKEYMEQKGL